MTLTIVPNKDLQSATSRLAGPDAWQSSGEDPAFKLMFSTIRQPFLVIHIGGFESRLIHAFMSTAVMAFGKKMRFR